MTWNVATWGFVGYADLKSKPFLSYSLVLLNPDGDTVRIQILLDEPIDGF